jgi:uncharacterized membrane protein YfcA
MPDLATLLPLVAMLLAIGAVAGVLAGLLGVGGGLVLVPAFYYAFAELGFESPSLMTICLATSLATIVFTSARSVMAHHRKRAVDWAILRGWAPWIALGAALGMLAAAALRSATLMSVFAGLCLLVGLYTTLGRSDWRLGAVMPTGLRRAAIGPVVGFLSVLLGIGGGSLGVPLMTLHGVPVHRAVATAAGFGLVIAVPSVAGFLVASVPPGARPPLTVGHVNLPAFAIVIAMTLLTAPLGVRLAHATDPKRLKRIFGVFLLVVGLNMLRKAWML